MTSNAIARKIKEQKNEIEWCEKNLKEISEGNTRYHDTPSYYKKDKEKCEQRIAELEKQYRETKEAETEANKRRNIPEIIEFLTEWGKMVYEYDSDLVKRYKEDLTRDKELRNTLKERYPEYRGDFCDNSDFNDPDVAEFIAVHDRLNGKHEIETRRGHKQWSYRKLSNDMYSSIMRYTDEDNGDEILRDDIIAEAGAKYDDLIYRVQKYVGEIKGAEAMEVGNNGSLNGYIYGEEKEVFIRTIVASGPVQRPHFRVIVTERK